MLKNQGTRWADLYMTLLEKGHNVYSPGIKEGICTEKYVVVKYNGSKKHTSFSSTINYYSVLIYIPSFEYSTVEAYVSHVIKDLKELSPMIKQVGDIGSVYYDDEVKAHKVSIEYLNYKQIEGGF